MGGARRFLSGSSVYVAAGFLHFNGVPVTYIAKLDIGADVESRVPIATRRVAPDSGTRSGSCRIPLGRSSGDDDLSSSLLVFRLARGNLARIDAVRQGLGR
jgi:hypothetical protein